MLKYSESKKDEYKMSTYKGYNSNWGKEASKKYIKEKQKSILLRWKKDDWESRIEPAIKATGMPVVTFIKEAVEEKLKRIEKEKKK